MAYKYEGMPPLASLDENDWGESRDAVRLALHRIDRALKQVFVGSNPLGSGNPTPQNIGGLGGGTVTVNQVDENDFLTNDTDGILVFGRGETDSLAHAIRVSQEGEILIAELPSVVLSAGFDNSEAFPDFLTHIGTIQYGKREAGGTGPTNMGRLCVGDFPGGTILNDGLDDDVGLCVMPSPKQHSRNFAEFHGMYYSGGAGLGINISMSNGTGDSGSALNSYRFSRGAVTLTTGVTGSPTGTIKLFLYARNFVNGPNVYQRVWEFDEDTFIDGVLNSHFLEFEIYTPFISFQIIATGTDSSNYFDIGNFYLNLSSGS